MPIQRFCLRQQDKDTGLLVLVGSSKTDRKAIALQSCFTQKKIEDLGTSTIRLGVCFFRSASQALFYAFTSFTHCLDRWKL